MERIFRLLRKLRGVFVSVVGMGFFVFEPVAFGVEAGGDDNIDATVDNIISDQTSEIDEITEIAFFESQSGEEGDEKGDAASESDKEAEDSRDDNKGRSSKDENAEDREGKSSDAEDAAKDAEDAAEDVARTDAEEKSDDDDDKVAKLDDDDDNDDGDSNEEEANEEEVVDAGEGDNEEEANNEEEVVDAEEGDNEEETSDEVVNESVTGVTNLDGNPLVNEDGDQIAVVINYQDGHTVQIDADGNIESPHGNVDEGEVPETSADVVESITDPDGNELDGVIQYEDGHEVKIDGGEVGEHAAPESGPDS